jgi:hypothetical protein
MLKRIFKHKWIFLAILFIGLALRTYNARETFNYGHDQDLAGSIVIDVVVNKHLRLIGQLTSTEGIFTGPIYYYFLIPFYLAAGMDPIGAVAGISLLGLISIASYIFVFYKLFGRLAGIVAGTIYAVSFYMVFNDREVAPTMPVMLWSVWYFYAINLLLKGKGFGYLLSGILFGLIWHINMALLLTVSLGPLAIFLSRKKLNPRGLIKGALALLFFSIPLIAFEARHHFPQTNAFLAALTAHQKDVVSGLDKLVRVVHLGNTNAHNFLLAPTPVSFWLSTALLLAGLSYISAKKLISKGLLILMAAWWGAYILFFALYSKVVSEYYLNAVFVIWVAILAISISHLLQSKKFKFLGILLLLIFIALNLYRFVTYDPNRSGYLEKKALVESIDNDRKTHGYPCVAVSFITDPGYEYGYRYFFWLRGMHVTTPSSGAPVYSIVFPHSKVGRIDKSFGALALVLPDYERYSKEGVAKSCSGPNTNLTGPMFLYTQ